MSAVERGKRLHAAQDRGAARDAHEFIARQFGRRQIDQRGGVGTDGDQPRTREPARRARLGEALAQAGEGIAELQIFEGKSRFERDGHQNRKPQGHAVPLR
jgi:hypothetical protein